MQKAGKKIGTKRNKISIKRHLRGRDYEGYHKKVMDNCILYDYPNVQQKEKKQNI
jgi:hypothetical protein